ncbi:MAG: hypothetical protein FWD33_03590 [Alphaproteobacteria bacterium]|nr:hypothetical protein [Alphaproteobacteria bacterium]
MSKPKKKRKSNPVAKMMLLCGRFAPKVVPDRKKEDSRKTARRKVFIDRERGE